MENGKKVMTSAFFCSHVSCVTHSFQGAGEGESSIIRGEGVGRHRHCRHARKREDWARASLLAVGVDICACFLLCVLRIELSITLQQSSTMTEEEEMQGYCCCVIGTEYMLFFLWLCCFYSLAFQMVQQRPLIFSQRDSDLVVRTPTL